MLRRPAVTLILCGFAVMVAFWAVAVGCPAAFDYAEGDTATWIWLVKHGYDVYAKLDGTPMLSSNYPPVQLQLVAHLAPGDGAILPVGRLLALGGFLVAMSMVGVSVGAATRSRKTGVVAALLFGATCQPGYHAAVCRSDALALGLGCVGVTLAALRARGWPLLCALVFAASLLCKHNLIVFPGGVILWALVREPLKGLVLALTTAGLLVAALVRLQLGEPLVLWSIAGFEPLNLLRYLGQAVAPSVCGLVVAVWAVRNRARFSQPARAVLEPWLCVLGVGVVWWLALGRTGASANYLLEYLAALTVVVSVAVHEGAPRRWFYGHLALTVAETAAWVGVLVAVVLPGARRELVAAHAALKGVRGGVFAEQPWQTTSAGHPPVVMPFLSTQLAYAHRWDPAPLERALEHGFIERLFLNFPLEEPAANNVFHRDRYLSEELDAMRARYVAAGREGNLYIYQPRPRP